MAKFAMTINGQAVADDGPTFAVINPATEEVVGHAPDCTREQLDAAVASSRAAYPAWSTTPIDKRREVMRAIAGVIGQNLPELVALLVSEQGKPASEATVDVGGAAYWFTKVADQQVPEEVVEDSETRKIIIRHAPLGVVGAIVPWNFPIMLISWKAAPALLTGNTIIIKPSPFTPLTTLRLGELLRGVVPPGVINFVSGGDALGPMITSHAGIDKISFTGSSATGRRVMASASDTLKRVTLELGGNDAAIVLPDTDVAAFTKDLFWAAFANCGQVCVATKRMYVHEAIYDQVRDALVAFGKTVKVGNGSEADVKVGPLNNKPQYERVRGFIDDCKQNGYTFALGGEVPQDRKGFFVPLTIVDNPPEASRIVSEEQFGPVLPLIKFSDVEEVIKRVNASPYGLGSSIWTGTSAAAQEAAIQLSTRIQAGTVWINESQHITPDQPFGGAKQSGMGSEGGAPGLLAYTTPQTVCLKKQGQPAAAAAGP